MTCRRILSICTLLLAASSSPAQIAKLTSNEQVLSFCYQVGSQYKPVRVITLGSSGGPVNFTATPTAEWINAWPPSGVTPAGIAVEFDGEGLEEGVYSGSITIAGADAANGTLFIAITAVVGKQPCIAAEPQSLRFNYRLGGPRPEPQCFYLTSSAQKVEITASVDAGDWMSVAPMAATLPAKICAIPNPTNLSQGEYTALIQVKVPTGNTLPVALPVNVVVGAPLLVISPILKLSPETMYFDYRIGASLPPPQLFTISSATTQATLYIKEIRAPWLALTPVVSATPATFALLVNPTGLTPGTYTEEVSFSSPDISEYMIPKAKAVLRVREGPACSLIAGPALLTFHYRAGEAIPPPQKVTVRTLSDCAVPFSAVPAGVDWLTFKPMAGAAPASFEVAVNPRSSPPGFYSTTITVASQETADSPRIITVVLVVMENGNVVRPTIWTDPVAITESVDAGEKAQAFREIGITSSGNQLSFQVDVAGGSWLTVDKTVGVTPQKLFAVLDGRKLSPGTHRGSITLHAADSSRKDYTIPVTLEVLPDVPVVRSVANGASMETGPISPGQIVTILGSALSAVQEPQQFQGGSAGVLPRKAGESAIYIEGVPAPILLASKSTFSVLTPAVIANKKSVTVQAEHRGKLSAAVTIPVQAAAPGVYTADLTGQGQVAAVNQDGSLNSWSRPAARLSVIRVMVTGFGEVTPPIPDDMAAAPHAAAPRQSVRAEIGDLPAEVVSAEIEPDSNPGILTVRLRVPEDTQPGRAVKLKLSIGSWSSQPKTTIAVE